MIITTNLGFGERAEVFRNGKLATAVLARVGRNARIYTPPGASHHTSKRSRGRGGAIE